MDMGGEEGAGGGNSEVGVQNLLLEEGEGGRRRLGWIGARTGMLAKSTDKLAKSTGGWVKSRGS